MPKKAQEFLLDTKLGEKKFDLGVSDENGMSGEIALNIEGITPVAVLRKRSLRKKPFLLFARLDTWIKSLGKVSAKDLATFFRLLSVMINAGIPLIRSLEVIVEQIVNAKLRRAIEDMRSFLETGGTLSGGMNRFRKIFTPAQIGMVRSGEASGNLNKILPELATDVEKLNSIRRKVKGALLYPSFVIIVLIAVVIGMLVFVVPKIADIFKDTGQTLPFITRAVMGASDWIRFHTLLLASTVIALTVGFTIFRKTKSGKYAVDELLLHIPLIGSLVKRSVLARFSRSLKNLLQSGVPIIEALHITADGLGSDPYRERVMLAAEDLSKGIPLGESLRDTALFPQLMVQMIIVGEQTAELDNIAGKVADYYEEEVDVAVSSLTKTLEPVMIVLVGATVGAIVAAIMLPIIQLVSISEAF